MTELNFVTGCQSDGCVEVALADDGAHVRSTKLNFVTGCNSDGCVEVALGADGAYVRDSKTPGSEKPTVLFTWEDWEIILDATRFGKDFAVTSGSMCWIRTRNGHSFFIGFDGDVEHALHFDTKETDNFIAAAASGVFDRPLVGA